MPEYKIEIPGFNKYRDRLDAAIIQLTAQKLYNAIKEKVPEIETEKSKVIFSSIGKNLVLDSTNLSSQLQQKLQHLKLSF